MLAHATPLKENAVCDKHTVGIGNNAIKQLGCPYGAPSPPRVVHGCIVWLAGKFHGCGLAKITQSKQKNRKNHDGYGVVV